MSENNDSMDFDELLGVTEDTEGFFEAEKPEPVESSETPERSAKEERAIAVTLGDVEEEDMTKPTDKSPALMGESYPEAYLRLARNIREQYHSLPTIDYDQCYAELSELSVPSVPTPTLQVINDEIQKVQAAKDRLAEIFVNVLRCFTLKKRLVDILRDSWNKFSTESSQDKRKGDASFRLSDFDADFAETESLLKSCTHILRNLDSLHDSLSRRITVIQLQLKLHDFGRGALPDIDWDESRGKSGDDDTSSLFDEPEKDGGQNKDGKLEAEEWDL